ncbi:MAG: glycosyltransferase [Bacteroidetes bacterium]|nr:glycosyltransferase [Bacteroidota bacterium]
MNLPKISIVTPSFNQAEYLEQTILSVINQGYPNLEYIVIDGGSTDGSVEVIKKYADKITYWVSERDKGQYDAINKGFSHSTGEIMGWINSSDLLYPWTLKFVAEIFRDLNEVQWLVGMPTNLSIGNAPQRVGVPKLRNIYDIIAGDYKWIQQESVFWSRELWEKTGGKLDISVKYAEDFNLWLRFYEHAQLYNVNTILGGFRYHDIRRGGGEGGAIDKYSLEAQELHKKFKSHISLKYRFQANLVKLFSLNKNFQKKVIRKLHILPWYRHRCILYNFHTDKWEVDIR